MSHASRDTIFALSSGRGPAAIAVIRISGPRAGAALEALGVKIPEPRRAGFARLRDPASGEIIDEGLALWFPGPRSETGEDVAELQPHGGRAVIAAVLKALSRRSVSAKANSSVFSIWSHSTVKAGKARRIRLRMRWRSASSVRLQ